MKQGNIVLLGSRDLVKGEASAKEVGDDSVFQHAISRVRDNGDLFKVVVGKDIDMEGIKKAAENHFTYKRIHNVVVIGITLCSCHAGQYYILL